MNARFIVPKDLGSTPSALSPFVEIPLETSILYMNAAYAFWSAARA